MSSSSSLSSEKDFDEDSELTEKNKLIKSLQHKNLKLKRKLHDTEMENMETNIRMDKEMSNLRERLHDAEERVQTLEKQLNDPDNVHMKSSIQALKLHETLNDLEKIQLHQKKISTFLEYITLNVEEVMSISRTHINVGDYVYFEAGSHNYPLGLVENIQSVGGEKRYTVKHGDASYFVTQKQIYKTDGKKKPTIPSEFDYFHFNK